MALKDCTFTITIDGKTRTFDYDGLRVFLLKPKNMAAVAPSFAGRDVNAVREAERKKAGKQAPTRSESDLSFTVGTKDKVMAESPDVLFTIQPGRQYFTLTGHLKERTGPAAGTYDEGVFLRNLPTDPDEARAAAEEFMRKVATGEGSGHAFTTERGELWAAAGRASYGLIPTPLTKEDLIGLNDELIGRRPMEVGKYKGTSLNEVMKRDPAYAVWAADYQTGTPTMREAGEYIKRHPDYKTARANLEAAWAKADTPGVQALLKKAGIRYFISGISATLMDKTYPYKDILKESGGKFDNQHKFWTVDLDGFNKLVGAVAGRKGSGPSTLRQDVEPDIVNEVGPLWRSTLGLAMESWPNKGTPEQLMAHIAKTRGATEEAKWVELNKLLEGKNTVTKQEVMDYLEANPFVLGEVVLQGEKIRYPESEVRLPGGQGEGELVITFPKIKGYKGHHFPHDTDSYLVHVRFVERRGVNGQRVLFVEEIQSDLHQQARKYGYATPEVVQAKIKELELKRKPIERQREELRDKAGKMAASIAIEQNLALKTLKEDAAFNPQKRNPLDQAAWVQDDDGVDERTLRIPEEFMSLLDEMERAGGVEGFTDSIKQAVTLPRDDWSRSAIPDETINTFEAVTRNGLLENVQSIIELRGKINELNQEALSLSWQGDRLLDEVRQLRKQMLPDAPYKQTSEWATLAAKRMLRWAAENGYDEMAWTTGEVQTERTGTEFYKFYDEILPKSLAKFIKQWGATIEQTDIEIPGKGVMAFPTVKMSARMKNAALRGMTLFQKEKLPSPQAPAKESGRTPIASWFSGTGTVEAALGDVRSVVAVEYDPAIIAAFNEAHGTSFSAQDVAKASPIDVRRSEAQLFHASPVCKNFSKANRLRSPNDSDLVSAKAVARVIREASPPAVTVENVPAYADTELFKLITDALTEKGYKWRTVIIDAADLGAPQRRKRLILQAVRSGKLPALPKKQAPGDWYRAVSDLIADAPDSQIPDWEMQRLKAMTQRGTLDLGKPIITMGGSVGASVAAASNAGTPAPTLKAGNQVARILLPNGKVKRVTPRMMARLMGLPDSFPVPDNPSLATIVLGNGVQGEMTRQLIKPLLESVPSPQAPAKGKIDPADLVANLREKVDLTAVPPVKKSKHATGAEARQALQDLTKNSMQEEMELQRLYQELRRVRQPLLQGTRGMTQAQVDKLEGEFNAVKDAYLQALAKQRLRAIDEVAPGGLAGITWEGYQTEKEVITTGKYSSEFEKAVKGISKDAEQRVNEGVELFKRIVGDHPALRGKKLDVRILGQGEGNRRERYSFSPIDELERTALAAGGGHVMLTAKSPNSVIVHEMGHWMEHAVPEATKRISQFLKRRSKAELLSPLNALEVTNQYDDAELGVADEFIVPYIGKYYARGISPAGFRPDWNRIYASEVLSMGLQYMYENPVKFAQQDPEMFDLIFDILRMGR